MCASLSGSECHGLCKAKKKKGHFFFWYSLFLFCNSSNDKLKKEPNMEGDLQKSLSLRLNRRGDRNNQNPPPAKGNEGLCYIIHFLKCRQLFWFFDMSREHGSFLCLSLLDDMLGKWIISLALADILSFLFFVGDADSEVGIFSSGRPSQDYPIKIVWKKGFIRLVLVAGILWMLLILIALLFHIWSCQSSVSFLSG